MINNRGGLESALLQDRLSHTGCGSEFRPWHILAPLFHKHPFWSHARELLICGSTTQAKPLTGSQRRRANREALAFGNHKGAKKNTTLLRSLLEDEAKYGYAIVLPMKHFLDIPGLLLSPMNLVAKRKNVLYNGMDIYLYGIILISMITT